jgi:hypothetical protein
VAPGRRRFRPVRPRPDLVRRIPEHASSGVRTSGGLRYGAELPFEDDFFRRVALWSTDIFCRRCI